MCIGLHTVWMRWVSIINVSWVKKKYLKNKNYRKNEGSRYVKRSSKLRLVNQKPIYSSSKDCGQDMPNYEVRICRILFFQNFLLRQNFLLCQNFSSSKFASTYCYIHAAVGAIQGFRDQNGPRGFCGLEIIPLLRISLVEISRKFPNTFFLWWNSVL